MINIQEKDKCCGCGACAESCQQKCIVMKEDQEGFLYPDVNKGKCLDCGLCDLVCPLKTRYENENASLTTYVAYDKNTNNRLNSSSGGLFGVIAQEVFSQNGEVCGVTYDDHILAKHILIDYEDDLEQLRGSKYVQSYNEEIFNEIKQRLQVGKQVLYSGTACQVAALKKYLLKEYDNLLTVDVLCHGVPSPKLWKKYISEVEKKQKSKIKRINLRCKESGWKDYSVKIELANGKSIYEKSYENNYLKLFLNNICIRPSCHNCMYKEINHPSDITIGDCWGIEHTVPEFFDDKGTSIIMLHTNKGKEIFDKIKDNLEYKQVDIDLVLPKSSDSRKSVIANMNRGKFFANIDKKNMTTLVKYLNPSIADRIKRKVRGLKNGR